MRPHSAPSRAQLDGASTLLLRAPGAIVHADHGARYCVCANQAAAGAVDPHACERTGGACTSSARGRAARSSSGTPRRNGSSSAAAMAAAEQPASVA